MGLLDDAIREHLELKRRRGADDEEVTRLEQEALGPPQRGEFAGARAPAAATSASLSDAVDWGSAAAPKDAVIRIEPSPLTSCISRSSIFWRTRSANCAAPSRSVCGSAIAISSPP